MIDTTTLERETRDAVRDLNTTETQTLVMMLKTGAVAVTGGAAPWTELHALGSALWAARPGDEADPVPAAIRRVARALGPAGSAAWAANLQAAAPLHARRVARALRAVAAVVQEDAG